MLVNKDFHQPPTQCVFSLNIKQKPALKLQNADVNGHDIHDTTSINHTT